MKRQIKKTTLATVILIMLIISQTVSAAPLHPMDSGPVSQFMYDNFDDNFTDPALWTVRLNDSGPAVFETNQRLEITVPANSTGDDFAAWYDSTCQLRGDYDIQVDYELLTWPNASGVRLGLTDTHANMHRVSSGGQPNDYPGGPDLYMTLFDAGDHWITVGITPTSDPSGKLRLQRVGDTINTFYFANGIWMPVASNSGSTYAEDTPFALGAWSADSVFTDQEVKVAFDNLMINAVELVCPSASAPDLAVTQTADQVTVSTGDPVGFTIAITNNGDAAANMVTLSDTLPVYPEFSWAISGTDATACTITDGIVSCNFGDMPPGAVKTIQLTAPEYESNSVCFSPTIISVATIVAANHPEERSAIANTTVLCPNAYVEVWSDSPGVTAGDPISFNTEFGNLGDGIARNVLAEIVIPTNPGLSWSIMSIIPAEAANNCVFGNDSLGTYELICSFDQLPAGQVVSITLTSPTTSESCGRVESVGYLTLSNGSWSRSIMKAPYITCPVAVPDLAITQVADQETVSTGDPIGFTITVTNNGNATANIVTLTDTLPVYPEFGWSIGGMDAASCVMTDGVVSCNFQNIEPGAVKTIRITAPEYEYHSKCFSPVITSTATVVAYNQPANKTATASVNVLCPYMFIDIYPDTIVVQPGDPVSYTVTIGNQGDGNAKDVDAFFDIQNAPGMSWAITDVTPSSAASNCTFGPYGTWMELECIFDQIAPLEEVSITLSSPTSSESCGVFSAGGVMSASNNFWIKTKRYYITVNCPQSVYDNFDDNATDLSLWSVGQEGGPVAVETNQRLEITLPANSAGDQFDASYYSTCLLRGDFDIQVDYELLTWPTANGVRISLNTNHGNMERASFGASGDFAGGPEVYLTDFAGLVKGITPTTDSSGKLRLQRAGDTLTGFYLANGVWTTVASNSDPTYTQDASFALSTWSHDPVFADQEVKVAFDNMIVNAGELVCPVVDTTPPVITPTVTGTLGTNGWYIGDVSLTWSVTDPESAISSTSGCEAVSITQNQAATDYTCTATSAGGTTSETTTIKRDGTKPVTSVTNVVEGATYAPGSVPQAGCSSTDNLSGMAAEAILLLTGGDAQGLGYFTAICSGALDAAGNVAVHAVVHYTVNNPSNTYNFTGFFQPVDNWPMENTMKAGASVPIRFSLGGNMGLSILASGSPTSSQVACPSSSALTADAIEEITTSNSGLIYDAASEQYLYVWKTNKTWANTCRVFTLLFADGSSQRVLFKFSK